jgi:hypothetical protein
MEHSHARRLLHKGERALGRHLEALLPNPITRPVAVAVAMTVFGTRVMLLLVIPAWQEGDL